MKLHNKGVSHIILLKVIGIGVFPIKAKSLAHISAKS